MAERAVSLLRLQVISAAATLPSQPKSVDHIDSRGGQKKNRFYPKPGGAK
jgi:hypothetical protein